VTARVSTGSTYRLAVSAEMVFVDLPFLERVLRIADAGFEVEIYDGVVGLEGWASGDPELALERFRTAFTV
jgi:hydroxypyruvate isomerase